MRISIITVCFNAEKTIKRTMESILEQTMKDFEWIVVDGQSKDRTNEIIKSYLPRFQEMGIEVSYISEKDDGIYDAMNRGANMARGEYLTYMNADDFYYNDNSIKEIYEVLKSTSSDIVYGDTYFIKPNVRYVERAKRIETIIYHLPFCPQAAFVRTEVQRELQFDTQFRISADYDFFLRAFIHGKKFQKVNQVVAVFNFGGASNENLIKTYKDDVAVKVKNGLEKKNSFIRKIKMGVFIVKQRMN